MASVTDPSSPTVSPAPTEAMQPLVSVVIPCLNEAASIERCVELARDVLDEHELPGEVVVADNGSTDGSAELAARAGARVVREQRRGYGSAYLAGFAAAQGDYIVMADADLTYDLGDITRFVVELDGCVLLVMVDRMYIIRPVVMRCLYWFVFNSVIQWYVSLLL